VHISLVAAHYSREDLTATLNAALGAAHARAFRRLLCSRCVAFAVAVWAFRWLTGFVPAIAAWTTSVACVTVVQVAWRYECRARAHLHACLLSQNSVVPREPPDPPSARKS
jgi:hypothetical protein